MWPGGAVVSRHLTAIRLWGQFLLPLYEESVPNRVPVHRYTDADFKLVLGVMDW